MAREKTIGGALVLLGALIWSLCTPKTTIIVDSECLVPTYLHRTNEEILQQYLVMSDAQLVALLFQTPEMLFSGFSSSDIALSLLYERGLTVDVPLKVRKIWPRERVAFMVQGHSIACFSGLTERDIEEVQRYLLEEKAPYSAERLFGLLRGGERSCVREAFYRTREWGDLERLLSPVFKSREKLWRYISLFSWEGLQEHIALSHTSPEKVDVKRAVVQIMIADFMKTGSSGIARLLLVHAPRSTLMRARMRARMRATPEFFDRLFSHVPPDAKKSAVQLALSLIKGGTDDALFQCARNYLIACGIFSDSLPKSREALIVYLQSSGMSVIASAKKEEVRGAPPTPLPRRRDRPEPSRLVSQVAKDKIAPCIFYTVRKGDTLWAIATKFHVPIDKIRYLNHIRGTTLPPGRVLKIPKP